MSKYQKSLYVYTKLRKNFGCQPLFQASPAQLLESINPDAALQKDYILRNPVNKIIQATLSQSEHDANTKHVTFHEQGINHTEGGWPRDVHLYNEEHLIRHRRRIQHEDNYIHTVLSLKSQIEHYIDQNNAIEMYETYFSGMQSQAPVEKYKVQIQNVFRDPLARSVSCIVWTNQEKSLLVATYSDRLYPLKKVLEKNNCCVWDVNRETDPVHQFTTEYGCRQVACSPVDPEIIVTGLNNGTVKLFDTRLGTKTISSSSIYNSHREPITALLYSHSRTQTEFFTGSPDGQCLWWDTRKISQPIDQLPMSVRMTPGEKANLGNAEGISCLEFDRGFPTKFLSGTESGLIINANRMGRSHSEILTSYWNAHNGPVKAIQRSPCTPRMFISCGDWSVRIWSEEVRTAPIIVTKPHHYPITDVKWAPLRYSSYMVVSDDGYFYFWDLLRKHHEPITSLRVSKFGLRKIVAHPTGDSVAIGDTNGTTFLLNLSDNLVEPRSNDKQLMHQTYDRQTKREHILDLRHREIRLKLLHDEENITSPIEEVDNDNDLLQATENYFDIVKKEICEMDGVFRTSDSELLSF